MKICLIGAPTAVEFEPPPGGRCTQRTEEDEQPPLGILSLAAVLERAGIPLEILDLNGLFSQCAGEGAVPGEFFRRATSALQAIDADIIGFSTISSAYPLIVRLACEAKRAHPDTWIVLGGPQASAVDVETLNAFPFVDVVVRGEAEEVLPQVLAARARGKELASITGIAFREGGRVVRTPDPPDVPDLDRLPPPAYHLWPGLARYSSVPVELGRGCPFGCTFCSTSGFFRRRYRLKAPERVIGEMRWIRETFGIGRFSLLHDNFTADRTKAAAFCQMLLESRQGFQWSCSARTDCLDKDLLERMARAGCIAVFLGVETGSARLQREIGKGLDLGHARAMIRRAAGLRIKTVVSLITGFPGERQEDLQGTVEFLLDSARHPNVDTQFHLLAPLAGSRLCEQYREQLKWDGVFSDMSFQGSKQDGRDEALVLEHREVFPNFYALPTGFLDRPYLAELRDFLQYGVKTLRWLMLALEADCGDLLAAFERWRAWRDEHGRAAGGRQYYLDGAFRRDFLAFVHNVSQAAAGPNAGAVAAVLQYEEALDRARETASTRGTAADVAETTDLEAVPLLAPGVAMLSLETDYPAIVECLRKKRSAKDVRGRKLVVADRRSHSSIEVIELTPLAAALMKLCDGTRAVKDLATVFPVLEDGLQKMPPRAACLFALNELGRQGLIVFRAGPGPATPA